MKPLWISAGAAAAGAIMLAILFPRVDPSASLRLGLDRAKAIERARQLAARYGVDTAGWRAAVWDEASDKHRAYLAAYPDDPAARLFSPLTVTVVLTDPSGRRKAETALFPDGRPAEWKLTDSRGGAVSTALSPRPSAEDVLADFLGANRASFSSPVTSEREGVTHTIWDWSAPNRFPLMATIEMEQKDGVLRAAKLTPAYGEQFDRRFAASRTNRLASVALWVRALALLPALVFCFWAAIRGRFNYRIALLLSMVQLLWAAASFWGSTYQPQILQLWHPDGSSTIDLDTGINHWGWSLWAGLSFFTLFVFAGAGCAMRVAGNREKWRSLDLVARGEVRNSAVGGAVAIGLLSGIGLAAVPYVVAAVSGAAVNFHSTDALVAPFPGAVAVRLSAAVLAVELFGFLFPLAGYLKKPWLRWPVFVPAGLLLSLLVSPFSSPGAGLSTAGLLFCGYLLIYLRGDLLALMTAMVGARAVLVPCLLLSQPAGSLRQSGLLLLGVGAAAIAASVHLATRRREHEDYTAGAAESALADSSEAEPFAKSSRERLEAEFEVARRAQQDALPAAPPVLAGYSLAGWCEPARQVGGDLYDFFPLADGRLGITVADVSGKGVPAALYMMVTKGLLTAVSRDSSDLAYILEQINLHLYRACRRRVFVTMAAVALDAARHRLQYGRAGHNPMVWRRTRRAETVMLKPIGLGLGMAPAEAFKRNLEVQELELEPEDALVLYSDGVTEAVNEGMEQFGERRLIESLEAADGRSADDTRDALLRDLAGFMGAMPARDDITVVVLRVAA